MRTLFILLVLFMPVLFFGQDEVIGIQIHSIKATRQPSGDNGYTLDGIHMQGARAKLLNQSNFGPGGIYPKPVNIHDGYELTGSMIDVSSLPAGDMFFVGGFNSLEMTELFVQDEVDALYNWSMRGGKMIISMGQLDENSGIDTRILNDKWEAVTQLDEGVVCVPTSAGNQTELFKAGPFGAAVTSVNQGGTIKGSFAHYPITTSKVMANASGGEFTGPTVYLDCKTLDLVVADVDVYTDAGGVTMGPIITTMQDRFWVNTILFMDKLQNQPQLDASKGDSLKLLTSNYLGYQWYRDEKPIKGANDSTYIVTQPGTYFLEGKTNGGCLVRSDIYYKEDTLAINDSECELFVPTAFSPDENGVNEVLCLFGRCFQDIDFKIYDRWGEVVFQAKDRFTCWDGKYKGIKLNSGTYAWSCQATRPSGTKINERGRFTLLR